MDGTGHRLTALYKWANHYDPAKQSYSLRAKTGATSATAMVRNSITRQRSPRVEEYRPQFNPSSPTGVLPQRIARHDSFPTQAGATVTNAELWKANYFRNSRWRTPTSDGKLSWPELQAHRKKPKTEPTPSAPANKSFRGTGTFSHPNGKDLIFTSLDGELYYPLICSLKRLPRILANRSTSSPASNKLRAGRRCSWFTSFQSSR